MELECGDCLKLFTFAKLKEHKRKVHSTKKCEVCNLGMWVKGQDRTLENLIHDNELWETNSGDRNALKHFNNIEFKPLLKTPTSKLLANDSSDTKTLSLLPIPTLSSRNIYRSVIKFYLHILINMVMLKRLA